MPRQRRYVAQEAREPERRRDGSAADARTAAASRRRGTRSSSPLLALLFGALLLAPGMHKAAFNGQPGTKRDVALALTGGLADVSHALFLDRPRQLVQDAMGREDADEINVAIVVPPTTSRRRTHDDRSRRQP